MRARLINTLYMLYGRSLAWHWETEIRAFEKGIQQALKRLGK